LSCSGKKVEPAACGGIYPIILCAGKEEVYSLISELLDEICPLFPSGKFHVGGDEAPKREWEKCPRCQQKIKEEGLPDEKALQGYFTNRIIEVLKAKGKTPVCWNESLEAAALDKSSIIQYWMPTGAEATKNWASSGGKFIYSDMFTYYFDYPNSMSKVQRVYEEKLSLADEDCSDNPGLLGIECCLWTEHIRENKGLEEKLFPRLYAAAEKMWGTNSDYQEFLERLRLFISRFHPADMGLIPEESWNPTGEARLNESLGFLAMMSQSMSPEAKAEVSTSIDPQTLQRAFMEHFFEPADMPFLMRVMQGLLG
jgi:hexosaminidase